MSCRGSTPTKPEPAPRRGNKPKELTKGSDEILKTVHRQFVWP